MQQAFDFVPEYIEVTPDPSAEAGAVKMPEVGDTLAIVVRRRHVFGVWPVFEKVTGLVVEASDGRARAVFVPHDTAPSPPSVDAKEPPPEGGGSF